jgi:hypothetical protein
MTAPAFRLQGTLDADVPLTERFVIRQETLVKTYFLQKRKLSGTFSLSRTLSF